MIAATGLYVIFLNKLVVVVAYIVLGDMPFDYLVFLGAFTCVSVGFA